MFFFLLVTKHTLKLILGMTQRHEVDVAGSDFTVTAIRASAIDYLIPIAQSSLKLFIRNPAGTKNWWAFINPLTKEVTLFIIYILPIKLLKQEKMLAWSKIAVCIHRFGLPC